MIWTPCIYKTHFKIDWLDNWRHNCCFHSHNYRLWFLVEKRLVVNVNNYTVCNFRIVNLFHEANPITIFKSCFLKNIITISCIFTNDSRKLSRGLLKLFTTILRSSSMNTDNSKTWTKCSMPQERKNFLPLDGAS